MTRRREARQIYIVNTVVNETADSEEYAAEWRFSSPRAAAAFYRKAQQLEERGVLDYVGLWPAALYHSGQAAFEQLTEEVGNG